MKRYRVTFTIKPTGTKYTEYTSAGYYDEAVAKCTIALALRLNELSEAGGADAEEGTLLLAEALGAGQVGVDAEWM